MNEKDKALGLFGAMLLEMHSLYFSDEILNDLAKHCALISVDEIIKENDMFDRTDGYVQQRIDYWLEVKQEIIKL